MPSVHADILLVLHGHRDWLNAAEIAERIGRHVTSDVDDALVALAAMGLVSSQKSPVTLDLEWHLVDGARERAVLVGLRSLGDDAALG